MSDKELPVVAAADGSERHAKRRLPLWPWVVVTIVVAVGAAAFSFWWPMYQAQKVFDFVKANGGDVFVTIDHPAWLVVIDDDTFHPWFDCVNVLDLPTLSDYDTLIRNVDAFPEIQSVMTDVSHATPTGIRNLARFNGLEYVALTGNGKRIPLDWIASLPKLEVFRLEKVSLTERDAEIISTMPALTDFELDHCQTSLKFWEVLASHGTLHISATREVPAYMVSLVYQPIADEFDIGPAELSAADHRNFQNRDVHVYCDFTGATSKSTEQR